MTHLIIYLFIINAVGLYIMHADKEKAKKSKWRIPEAAIWTAALLGGSLGCTAGMRLFHHKTKHLSFALGLPLLLCVQILLLIIFFAM